MHVNFGHLAVLSRVGTFVDYNDEGNVINFFSATNSVDLCWSRITFHLVSVALISLLPNST